MRPYCRICGELLKYKEYDRIPNTCSMHSSKWYSMIQKGIDPISRLNHRKMQEVMAWDDICVFI